MVLGQTTVLIQTMGADWVRGGTLQEGGTLRIYIFLGGQQ